MQSPPLKFTPHGLFIGGRWVAPADGKHFASINPSNMECGACPFTDPSCTSAGDVGIPLFTYGNLGRNSVTGPGINNWDISIVKKTAIGEGSKSVEFRAEFFNAFNHVQFFRVDNAGGSSTFGQVLTDRGPRLIQFGLKLYF